ncbi:hypothetical protein SFC65_19960 [Priestia filamentosa]|uniref:hypothetical protein n=1 Tax=Priestia filamentosa TaxID=1402861 RepID=UPI003982CB5B
MNREIGVPMLLIMIGWLISILFHPYILVVLLGNLLVCVGIKMVLLHKERVRKYKTRGAFIKGELDTILLLSGVVLYTFSSFFEGYVQTGLRLTAFISIFSILIVGTKLKERRQS